MEENMNYQEACKILEVPPLSNKEEIKKAYKRIAKKYHPDLYRGDKKVAEEKMKQINAAYTFLSKENFTPHQYNSYSTWANSRSTTHSEYKENPKYQTYQDAEDEFVQFGKKLEKEWELEKKLFKKILAMLSILPISLSLLLLAITIQSTISFLKDGVWILFGLSILLDIFSLAIVIFIPIGIVYLLKSLK